MSLSKLIRIRRQCSGRRRTLQKHVVIADLRYGHLLDLKVLGLNTIASAQCTKDASIVVRDILRSIAISSPRVHDPYHSATRPVCTIRSPCCTKGLSSFLAAWWARSGGGECGECGGGGQLERNEAIIASRLAVKENGVPDVSATKGWHDVDISTITNSNIASLSALHFLFGNGHIPSRRFSMGTHARMLS